MGQWVLRGLHPPSHSYGCAGCSKALRVAPDDLQSRNLLVFFMQRLHCWVLHKPELWLTAAEGRLRRVVSSLRQRKGHSEGSEQAVGGATGSGLQTEAVTHFSESNCFVSVYTATPALLS